MSKKFRRYSYDENDFKGAYTIEPTIVSLAPGTIIFVEESSEITKLKMKTKSWSTGIGKCRHYLFIRSDGRFATCLPISSRPPKNPYHVVFTDTMRTGKKLTIRCDEITQIDLASITSGEYSNFGGVSYTLDKATTLKVITLSWCYMIASNYTRTEILDAFNDTWQQLPIIQKTFKDVYQKSNMDYDFDTNESLTIDDNFPELQEMVEANNDPEKEFVNKPDHVMDIFEEHPHPADDETEEDMLLEKVTEPDESAESETPKEESEAPKEPTEKKKETYGLPDIYNKDLKNDSIKKQIENIRIYNGKPYIENIDASESEIAVIQESNITYYIRKYWQSSSKPMDLMEFVSKYKSWAAGKGIRTCSISEILFTLENEGFKAQQIAPHVNKNKRALIALLACEKTEEESEKTDITVTSNSDIKVELDSDAPVQPPVTRNWRGIRWTTQLINWTEYHLAKGNYDLILKVTDYKSISSLRSVLNGIRARQKDKEEEEARKAALLAK